MADDAITSTGAAPEGTPAPEAATDATVDVAQYTQQIEELTQRNHDLQSGFTELSQSVPKELRERLNSLGDGRDKALALVEKLAGAGVDWDEQMEIVDRSLDAPDPLDSAGLPPEVLATMKAQQETLAESAKKYDALMDEVNSLKSSTVEDRQLRSQRHLEGMLNDVGLPMGDNARGRAIQSEVYGKLYEKFNINAYETPPTEAQIDAIRDDVTAFAKECGFEPQTTQAAPDVVHNYPSNAGFDVPSDDGFDPSKTANLGANLDQAFGDIGIEATPNPLRRL